MDTIVITDINELKGVGDPMLNEFYQQVRERFGDNFLVREQINKDGEYYTIYRKAEGSKYGIINFYCGPENPYCEIVELPYALTFLTGLLNSPLPNK
jgi:hypothetical protein